MAVPLELGAHHAAAAWLLELPEELVVDILSYLSVREILACSCVCWRLRRIARHQQLWREIALRLYHVPYSISRQLDAYKLVSQLLHRWGFLLQAWSFERDRAEHRARASCRECARLDDAGALWACNDGIMYGLLVSAKIEPSHGLTLFYYEPGISIIDPLRRVALFTIPFDAADSCAAPTTTTTSTTEFSATPTTSSTSLHLVGTEGRHHDSGIDGHVQHKLRSLQHRGLQATLVNDRRQPPITNDAVGYYHLNNHHEDDSDDDEDDLRLSDIDGEYRNAHGHGEQQQWRRQDTDDTDDSRAVMYTTQDLTQVTVVCHNDVKFVMRAVRPPPPCTHQARHEFEGVWRGNYGPHGIELIEISYAAPDEQTSYYPLPAAGLFPSARLEARKLTGDPNVHQVGYQHHTHLSLSLSLAAVYSLGPHST